MATWREVIYIVLDELKLNSDDSSINEEHVMFLFGKYRSFMLKQQYKDIKKDIPKSNFQTLCLEVEKVPVTPGNPCDGTMLRSKEKIPYIMSIAVPSVYASGYFTGDISFISMDRMRYVGNNKWLQNILYAAIGPDSYLYLKSQNPQSLYLENISLTGIFEEPEKAAEYECDKDGALCDVMDRKYPLEEALIPQVTELVLKELTGSIYKPQDVENDANDNLATLAAFIRNNMKSNLQKQIES